MRSSLRYDDDIYHRYDSGMRHDEALKRNELTVVQRVLPTLGVITRSLDIGAATGRYPTLFATTGISAYGIDSEPAAIDFIKRKLGDSKNPIIQVADAKAIPFVDQHFDLITCMMGTFAHFAKADIGLVLSEMARCLAADGHLIISTWDPECVSPRFLSIYSEDQNRELEQNLVGRSEIRSLLKQHGLETQTIYSVSDRAEVDGIVVREGEHHAATPAGLPAIETGTSMFLAVARKSARPAGSGAGVTGHG